MPRSDEYAILAFPSSASNSSLLSKMLYCSYKILMLKLLQKLRYFISKNSKIYIIRSFSITFSSFLARSEKDGFSGGKENRYLMTMKS